MKPLPYSPDDLTRAIDRLTAVLEDEFEDDFVAWGSTVMVLLCSIIDMTGVDKDKIVAHILKPTNRKDLQ